MQAHERHREEGTAAAAAKHSQQQAAEPADSDASQQHTTGSHLAQEAHTNGLYRLAESPVSEVATEPPAAGHDVRNGSVNGVSHSGAPGQRAAAPNVRAHCASSSSRGPPALQRRRSDMSSLARGSMRVGV